MNEAALVRPFWGTRVNVLNFIFSEDLSALCPFAILGKPQDIFAAFVHAYPIKNYGEKKDGYAQPAFRLSERCLVTIDVTEYSADWQGGDWPLQKDSLTIHGHEEYPLFRERMLGLHRKGFWGTRDRIKRGLSMIELWIAGNYPTDASALLNAPRRELFAAESMHVKLTFR